MMLSALWDELYRNNRHSRAGHYMMALSAVDNALWDIRGKYFKAPVYELLGGATRKAVEEYNPYWIEEAFPVNRLESFVQLRRNSTIPLATGEHFYNRREVSQQGCTLFRRLTSSKREKFVL